MIDKPKSSPALAGLTALALFAGSAFAAAPAAEQPPQDQSVASPEAPPAPAPHPVPAQQATTTAPANVPGDRRSADVKATFDSLDADHDGRIERAEANGNGTLATQFTVLDADADGKLSLREFAMASNLAGIKAAGGEPRRR